MSIRVGKAARMIRDSHGLSQREAAELLEVSTVHLCNIEKDKAQPSAMLADRYRELWDVDVYVLAWCLRDDANLPAPIRAAAKQLEELWKQELSEKYKEVMGASSEGSSASQ